MKSIAASFLLKEKEHGIVIETNTTHAIPRILEAMESQNIQREHLDYVIVTHVHLDHAGGAWSLLKACPNAILLCHPKTAKHLINPSHLIKSAKSVYGEETFFGLYGEIEPIPEARVRVMSDGEQFRWKSRNFRFLYTKGHANHHFCILDESDKRIYTGDSFGISYPHLSNGGRFIFPTTTPTDFDGEEALISLAKIVDSGAEAACLTHFGEIQNLRKHADDLEIGIKHCQTSLTLLDDLAPEERFPFLEKRMKEMIQNLAQRRNVLLSEKDWEVLDLDVNLNAQGLSYVFAKSKNTKD
ncbi:MBL fold metallo-hydrolase [Leptospira ryugenii]|nr:MBL fold metallo-hydrolase [Leptospira ryugenii]